MFYYNISTTYQKIGDLFCLDISLDFRTVCPTHLVSQTKQIKNHVQKDILGAMCTVLLSHELQVDTDPNPDIP